MAARPIERIRAVPRFRVGVARCTTGLSERREQPIGPQSELLAIAERASVHGPRLPLYLFNKISFAFNYRRRCLRANFNA